MTITEEIARLAADSARSGPSMTISTMLLDHDPGVPELTAAIRAQADPPLPDSANLGLEARNGRVYVQAWWDEPPRNKRRRRCDTVYRDFDVTSWKDGILTETRPRRPRVEGLGKRRLHPVLCCPAARRERGR